MWKVELKWAKFHLEVGCYRLAQKSLVRALTMARDQNAPFKAKLWIAQAIDVLDKPHLYRVQS